MILERIKQVLQVALGIPLTVLSLLFIARYIFTNINNIIPSISSFDPFGLIVGLLLIIIFFLVRSFTWNEILKINNFNPPPLDSAFLLALSELKRYIPGSILAIAGRVNSFRNFNIKTKDMLRMIGIESVLFVVATFCLSLPGFYFLFQEYNFSYIFYFVVTITLVLFWILFNRYSKYQKPFLLTFIAWVFYGIGTFLVISSVSFINPANIVNTISLIILSWLVGYLVIIAPLGLGVREGFLTFALSFAMPIGLAATLSVIARIAFTISELAFLIIVFLAKKYIGKLPKVDNHLIILCSSILTYIFYFTYVSFQKYTNFFTGKFDLGNMDQTVWNTFHGNIFQLTNPDGVNTVSRLAFHSDFILILLAPFYLIWEDPRMLLLIQAVTIATGSLFVYLIAKHILTNKNISVILAVSYLLNPFIQKQTLFDFHAVTLATTFLLAAIYLFLRNKYFGMGVLLLLAALTKEHVFGIVGLFLFYTFLKTKKVVFLVFSISSITLFYLLITQLIPNARGGEHFATEYFQQFGSSPTEIIGNFIFDPMHSASIIFTAANFDYVYKLFLTTGFTALISPHYLLFSLPDLLINLLSENENLKSITFHYAATIIPFVYISTIFGVRKIISYKIRQFRVREISVMLVIFSVISTYSYGTLPGSARPSLEVFNNKLENSKEIENFLNKIPANLSVAATNNIGSHVSQREKIFTIPIGMDQADVVLFLLNDNYASPSLKDQVQYAKKFESNPEYIMIYKSGEFVAFSKRESAKYIMVGPKSL